MRNLAVAANVTDTALEWWLVDGDITERTDRKLRSAYTKMFPGFCPCPQCRREGRPHPGGRAPSTQALVLQALSTQQMTVAKITRLSGLSATAVSRALQKLKAAGVVQLDRSMWSVFDAELAAEVMAKVEA